jgi:hypothetical protein
VVPVGESSLDYAFARKRMIVSVLDPNYISERLASLKQELSDLRVSNARYCKRSQHAASQKTSRALNQS